MPIKLHHIRAIPDPVTGDILSVDIFDAVTNTDADGDVTEKIVQSTNTDPALLNLLNALANGPAKQARKAARKAARDAAAAAAVPPTP